MLGRTVVFLSSQTGLPLSRNKTVLPTSCPDSFEVAISAADKVD